jgi:uncharacterized coiled-coil DUF342 family protein
MNIFEKIEHLNTCQNKLISLYTLKLHHIENQTNDKELIEEFTKEIKKWREKRDELCKELGLKPN